MLAFAGFHAHLQDVIFKKMLALKFNISPR